VNRYRGGFTILELVVTLGIVAVLGIIGLKISSTASEVSLRSAERMLTDELRQAREWSLCGGDTCFGLSFDSSCEDKFRRIKKSGGSIVQVKEITLPSGARFSARNSASMTTFGGDRVYFTSGGAPSMAGSIVVTAGRKVARITVIPDTGRVESRREGW